MIYSLWFSLILLFSSNALAAVENIDTFNDGTTPVVNENFRTLNDNVNKTNTNVAALTAYFTNAILGTAYGGSAANLSACTQGSIPYFSATGVEACLPPDTSGKVLTTQGASANPIFSTPTPPALVLISTTTISGAATTGDISITSGNTYFVQYNFINLTSSDFDLRFNGDSGSNYKYNYFGRTTTADISVGSASATQIRFSTGVSVSATRGANGSFYIQQLGTASKIYRMWGETAFEDTATGLFTTLINGGSWNNSADITSFALLCIGGVMTGTVYLYKVSTS